MKIYPVEHTAGKTDFRYLITPEYNGSPARQFVARFCGDYIGAGETLEDTSDICAEHDRKRNMIKVA